MLAQQNQTNGATAVKGYLITKSSPLATESCKLEKQFLTAQNMAAHYKRLLNVKPTLDLTPPKSLLTSQKARDRAKRDKLRYSEATKSFERARSAEPPKDIFEERAMEIRPATSNNPDGKNLKPQVNPRQLPDQMKLNKSMSNMMMNFTKKSSMTRTSVYKPPTPTSSSHDFEKNFRSPLSSARNVNNVNTSRSNNKLGGSIVSLSSQNMNKSDKMAHPALKATSRLVSGHNYDVLDYRPTSFKQPEKEFQPRIVNNTSASSKLKQSTYYQPPTRKKRTTPKPDDSLHKQNSDEEEHLNEFSKMIDNEDNKSTQEEIRSELNKSLNASALSDNNNTSRQSLKRAAEKEEEIKYLGFIKDVTDDIISRGICSNRVINNCFEFHIRKNKHILKEKKMRELLDTLRQDIGMPTQDEINVDEKYHQAINKAILLDRDVNKENLDQIGTEYLTLRKFGWSSKDQHGRVASTTSLNASQTSNPAAWHMIDDDFNHPPSADKQTQPQKSTNNINKNLFEDYENQIIRNIQSIRRKSLESEAAPMATLSENQTSSRKNSDDLERRKPETSINSLKSSDLNVHDHDEQTKENPNDSRQQPNQSKNASQSNKSNHDDDDDDDDNDLIFSTTRRFNRFNVENSDEEKDDKQSSNNIEKTMYQKRPSTAAQNNNNNNSSLHDEYSDDVLFKNDYGQEEESADENSKSESSQVKNRKASVSDSEHDNSIKNSISKNKKFQSEDEESDDDDLFGRNFTKRNDQSSPIRRVNSNANFQEDKSDSDDDDNDNDNQSQPNRKANDSHDSDDSPTPTPAPRKQFTSTIRKFDSDNDENDDSF